MIFFFFMERRDYYARRNLYMLVGSVICRWQPQHATKNQHISNPETRVAYHQPLFDRNAVFLFVLRIAVEQEFSNLLLKGPHLIFTQGQTSRAIGNSLLGDIHSSSGQSGQMIYDKVFVSSPLYSVEQLFEIAVLGIMMMFYIATTLFLCKSNTWAVCWTGAK